MGLTAAEWLARNVIGDDTHGLEPLPACERDAVAAALVADPLLGWPDLEAAHGTLSEWDWA